MNNTTRVGGAAIILFAVLFLTSFLLASPTVGLEDGDNPASSLEFLEAHADLYFYSGLFSALAAIALSSAVVCLLDAAVFGAPAPLLLRSSSGLRPLYGGVSLWARRPADEFPRTLLYMAGLNRDWGYSAYLAVQMAGTQGLAAAGIFGFGVWSFGLSVQGWRSGAIPKTLAAIGFLPALPWLLGLLARSDAADSLWLLYIGAFILGIPLWSVLLGLFLWRWRPTS